MTDTLDATVDRVIAHLIANWRRVFRLTTVDQALGALRIAPTWTLRHAVVDRLAVEPGLSPVLRRWGVATFALNNDERSLGRLLEQAARPLSLRGLAERLDVSPLVVRARLQMLLHCGIAVWEDECAALAADYAAHLGPLGWHSHEVQLDDEPPYNVPCAVDFLLLAHGAYPDRRLTLRDTCARSAVPICVASSGGTITAVEPPTALVFRGGG